MGFSHPRFDAVCAAVPQDERRESMHVVLPDGRVRSAGAAVLELAALLPPTGRLAWLVRLVARLWPVRAAVDRWYRRLAARRGELSGRVRDVPPTNVEPVWADGGQDDRP